MIGGEFEIDLSMQSDGFVPQPDTFYYASGRTALYQILRSLTPQHNKVWLPDWLCHTMVDAVEKAGLEYCFYELDADIKASIEALDKSGFKDGEAVLMINYFGLQDLIGITKSIKDAYSNAVVIEDDVQAFWVFSEKENPFADYCFTSLRKALPVSDGGLVKTKRPMLRATGENTFAPLKIKAGAMKYHRGEEGINDEDYLKLFKEGDKLIPENYDSVMSLDSQRLFAGTELDWAKKQRQANAAQLVAGLEEIGIKPMIPVSADSVPLFVPIYLENRDEVRRRMFQHEVYCPVHWPLDGMPVKRGADMAAHELSLIVDQRYKEINMSFIVNLLKQN